ncbi:hypothetical protein F4809DRAFT_625309, partial [Biscogniauxia mediterranea]
MAPPDPLPTYVYKIVPEAPPCPLPAEYPLSELDQKDGFVHLSTATQVSFPPLSLPHPPSLFLIPIIKKKKPTSTNQL